MEQHCVLEVTCNVKNEGLVNELDLNRRAEFATVHASIGRSRVANTMPGASVIIDTIPGRIRCFFIDKSTIIQHFPRDG